MVVVIVIMLIILTGLIMFGITVLRLTHPLKLIRAFVLLLLSIQYLYYFHFISTVNIFIYPLCSGFGTLFVKLINAVFLPLSKISLLLDLEIQ